MLVRLFLPAENNVPGTAVPLIVTVPQLSVAVGALRIPTAASFAQVVSGNIFTTFNLNQYSVILPKVSFAVIISSVDTTFQLNKFYCKHSVALHFCIISDKYLSDTECSTFKIKNKN